MRSMKLRVSGLYRQGEHLFPGGQLPLVQLAGGWLAEAGFPVGARVLVEAVGDGRLVLTRVDDAAAARATRPEAAEPEDEEPVELATWRRGSASPPAAPAGVVNRREAACA